MTSCKSPVKIVRANSLDVTVTRPVKQHPFINVYNTFYLSQLGLFPWIKKEKKTTTKNVFNPFVSSQNNNGSIFWNTKFQKMTYFFAFTIYNITL